MGMFRYGNKEFAHPPKEFMVSLKNGFKITDFLETGTFLGTTARWASSEFERVFTCEMSEINYKKSTEGVLAGIKNVICEKIPSTLFIEKYIGRMRVPSMFWLDAHYSHGSNTYGENVENPLIRELRIILRSSREHFIFIDDFRLIAFPDLEDYGKVTQWPTIRDIMAIVFENDPEGEVRVLFFHDVILIFNKKHERFVVENMKAEIKY